LERLVRAIRPVVHPFVAYLTVVIQVVFTNFKPTFPLVTDTLADPNGAAVYVANMNLAVFVNPDASPVGTPLRIVLAKVPALSLVQNTPLQDAIVLLAVGVITPIQKVICGVIFDSVPA